MVVAWVDPARPGLPHDRAMITLHIGAQDSIFTWPRW
jgi:hypothetical protein